MPTREMKATLSRSVSADVRRSRRRSVGMEIETLEAGSGPIMLVLIHGWACDSATWLPLIARLPREAMTVVVPDLPGFGGSTWRAPWTFERCAEVIADIVRTEAEGRAVLLCGHSMGGAVALTAASKLALAPTTAHVVLEAYAPTPPFGGPRRERLRLLRTVGTDGEWFCELVRSWYVSGISDDDLKAAVDTGRAASVEVLAASQEAVLRGVPPHVASVADGAATWIFGADDTNRDIESIRALAMSHAARLHIIPSCGHMPHYEAPDVVARAVLEQAEALACS